MKWMLALDGTTYPADANMKRDLELFNKVKSGEINGVLRIYNWTTPAITIGYHQKDFKQAFQNISVPVYKRPTGGGAVLHFDDITYSISVSDDLLGSININDSYIAVSEVFKNTFIQCGYPVIMQGASNKFSPVCFARSAPVELVLNGQKIMGAAQLRSDGFILQQGVIPVTTEKRLSKEVFGASYKASSVNDFQPLNRDEFIDKLIKNIKDKFAIEFS